MAAERRHFYQPRDSSEAEKSCWCQPFTTSLNVVLHRPTPTFVFHEYGEQGPLGDIDVLIIEEPVFDNLDKIETRKKHESRRITCRLIGSYRGQRLEAKEAVFLTKVDGKWIIFDYIWTDGNYSCDCNRAQFFGLTPERFPDLFTKGGEPNGYTVASGKKMTYDLGEPLCGHTICIERIDPIDAPDVEPLVLEEIEDA